MQEDSRRLVIALVLVLMLLGAFFLFLHTPRKAVPVPAAQLGTEQAQPAPSVPPVFTSAQGRFSAKPGVETRYVNTAHHFSFGIPDGFLAQDAPIPNSKGQQVVMYDEKKNGLAVLLLPVTGSGSELTAANVAAIAPGLQITNAQKVPVADGVSGLAFESNNPVWGGSAVELWFVYKGFLYRISTPSADADLVNFMWSSWQW